MLYLGTVTIKLLLLLKYEIPHTMIMNNKRFSGLNSALWVTLNYV